MTFKRFRRNLVKADKGGYGISWNDEIDLSCDELWEIGIMCIKMKYQTLHKMKVIGHYGIHKAKNSDELLI